MSKESRFSTPYESQNVPNTAEKCMAVDLSYFLIPLK